jgi:hypothetical protein
MAARSSRVTDLIRRFRGVGVAIVVLAMSAGVVFAAAPHGAPAANTAPNTETPSAGDDESEPPESEAPESEAPDEEASEIPATHDASEDADEPDGQEPAAETDDANDEGGAHGALVSAAARMVTPAGFRNHGAFVSCVAHLKNATLATIDWTTVTPEACGAASGNKSTAGADNQGTADAKAARNVAKAERKAARDAAKAERKAAKAAGGH